MGLSKGLGGMGFRDMSNVNQTMLTKQFWKLLINPCSLVARVMFEKYFKHDDILRVKKRVGSSLIWKSIWGVGNLVRDDLRWRVGNGDKIREW